MSYQTLRTSDILAPNQEIQHSLKGAELNRILGEPLQEDNKASLGLGLASSGSLWS